MPKLKRNKQRRKKGSQAPRTKNRTKTGRFKAFCLWLVTPTFVVAFYAFAYKYATADVRVEFSRSLGSGYEFSLRNDGLFDQLIERFRVHAPTTPAGRYIVFRTTQGVFVTGENGQVVLPG
jgi:hypothetical protein